MWWKTKKKQREEYGGLDRKEEDQDEIACSKDGAEEKPGTELSTFPNMFFPLFCELLVQSSFINIECWPQSADLDTHMETTLIIQIMHDVIHTDVLFQLEINMMNVLKTI